MPAFIHTIFPVLIGAVIGYFTNYIAIKMLFHPYNEIYIFGKRMPFSPGIIPRNKGRMARAVGQAVAGQLLTADALADNLRESNIKENLAEKAAAAVCENDTTIQELLSHIDGGESALDNAGTKVAGILVEKIRHTDLRPVVQGVVDAGLSDIASNPLAALFLTDEVKEVIYLKLTSLLEGYIDSNGEEIASHYLQQGLQEFGRQPLRHVMERADITSDMIRKMVGDAFDYTMEKHVPSVMKDIDIEGIVTNRIDSMSVPELEALLMSVMKQELQAVINLGALIGAVIGAVNIFI